ncbi:hypothetical protein JCM30394_33160 [Deferrisoma palaeochoriense]
MPPILRLTPAPVGVTPPAFGIGSFVGRRPRPVRKNKEFSRSPAHLAAPWTGGAETADRGPTTEGTWTCPVYRSAPARQARGREAGRADRAETKKRRAPGARRFRFGITVVEEAYSTFWWYRSS